MTENESALISLIALKQIGQLFDRLMIYDI